MRKNGPPLAPEIRSPFVGPRWPPAGAVAPVVGPRWPPKSVARSLAPVGPRPELFRVSVAEGVISLLGPVGALPDPDRCPDVGPRNPLAPVGPQS